MKFEIELGRQNICILSLN